MDCFAVRSSFGNFDVTPDPDCMMVYVESHRHKNAPQLNPTEVPSWCFEPQTIWFYFGAPESEDKMSAGARIKTDIQNQLTKA